MKKIFLTLSIGLFCLGAIASSSVTAAGQDDMTMKTKQVTKKTYHKSRHVTVKTWHHGKRTTKKVWHRGHHWGRKTVRRTKHVMTGEPKRP